MFLPRSLSAISDAKSALMRLHTVYIAQVVTDEPFKTDPELKLALKVEDADFQWEAVKVDEITSSKKQKGAKGTNGNATKKGKLAAVEEDAPPFGLRNIQLEIPRGTLCAIVGAGKLLITDRRTYL